MNLTKEEEGLINDIGWWYNNKIPRIFFYLLYISILPVIIINLYLVVPLEYSRAIAVIEAGLLVFALFVMDRRERNFYNIIKKFRNDGITNEESEDLRA